MKSLPIFVAAIVAISATNVLGQVRPVRGFGRGQIRQQKWRIPPQLPPALKLALGVVGNIKYSGTRVIEGKIGLNRVRHTEFVVTDGARSRIEFPTDSPTHGEIIVETPTERSHYRPSKNELEVLPPQREEAYQRLAKMVANGNAVVNEAPGGLVANLQTELVSIATKQGDVLQRLWIEPRSGMILKRELYAKGGSLQGSFEFTQVNLSPIIDQRDFKLELKGVPIVTPERRLDQIIRRQGFLDVRIPAGTPLRLEGARMQKLAEQQVLVQQYSGGGHRVTLYQVKAQIDASRLGNIAPAGVHTYSWQSRGSSFVLVGDLADTELRELGRRLGG